MGFRTVTWACLLLAACAGTSPADSGPSPPADVLPMNQRNFRIPIRINPDRKNDIKELLLYVSEDEGKQWQVIARAQPGQAAFAYSAPRDGIYWFTITIVDLKDQREPPDVQRAPVNMKLLIDTTRPQIELNAERQGDEVVARWTAREDNPDWPSLRLEYRPAEGPDDHWVSVGVLPGQNQKSFNPAVPGPVLLRMQMKDRVGNLGQATAEVPAGPARPATPTVSHQVDNAPGWPPTHVPPDAVPAPGTPPPGAVGQVMQQTSVSSPLARSMEASGLPLARPSAPLEPPPPPPPSMPPVSAAPGAAPSAPRGVLPQLRLVNKPDVSLEFEVSKFGPSGPGNVDIYVTVDEGATWEKYRENVPPTWPVTAFEGYGQRPVRGSVTLQLADEGVIYGFYLVVKSKAGLGKPPPQRGEPPQIRVEVDRKVPVAELYRPKADPNNREVLILSWKADDRNLAPNPITLEYAETLQGPWHYIGEPQLPNTTGHYPWKVSENVPSRVYLRMTVRDAAGNVAVAQTREPILVDLALPEVSVLGASATTRSP